MTDDNGKTLFHVECAHRETGEQKTFEVKASSLASAEARVVNAGYLIRKITVAYDGSVEELSAAARTGAPNRPVHASQQPAPPQTQTKTAAHYAKLSLILGIPGICFLPASIAAIVLGLMAIFKERATGSVMKKSYVGIGLGTFGVLFFLVFTVVSNLEPTPSQSSSQQASVLESIDTPRIQLTPSGEQQIPTSSEEWDRFCREIETMRDKLLEAHADELMDQDVEWGAFARQFQTDMRKLRQQIDGLSAGLGRFHLSIAAGELHVNAFRAVRNRDQKALDEWIVKVSNSLAEARVVLGIEQGNSSQASQESSSLPIVEHPQQEEDSTIGQWLDADLGAIITISRSDGRLFLRQVFQDSRQPTWRVELVERTGQGNRRFEKKRGSSAGDHWVIDSRGNLEIRDDEGLFATARKLD